jgi:hypothetical protein
MREFLQLPHEFQLERPPFEFIHIGMCTQHLDDGIGGAAPLQRNVHCRPYFSVCCVHIRAIVE